MSNYVVALVPMKKHSERVPNKNVREFNGRPLFHWILATLEGAGSVDEIVINTDSERIADEAPELFDVEIIWRPEHLQGDMVSMNQIILHDVQQVETDIFLQTHCTNPLLRSASIQESVKKFQEAADADSLFSVTPLQTRLWDENCEPINHERDELVRTQDLDPVYEENSNIYLFTEDSVTARENRIGDSPIMYSINAKEAIDIDEMSDFVMAEHLHEERHGTNPTLDEVETA